MTDSPVTDSPPAGSVPHVLVVQHDADNPPGWLGEWLSAAGVVVDLVRAYRGEPVPTSLAAGHAGLVSLGGEMGAGDDDIAPWLPATRELLRSTAEDGRPVLGICLGGQLLAAACGGAVERGPVAEIGLCSVDLSPAADSDPLLGSVPTPAPVTQWHQDGVTRLPPGAVVLASSPDYRTQAFRLGRCAWGLQWHPEAHPQMFGTWTALGAGALSSAGLDPAVVAATQAAGAARLQAAWRPMAERFARLLHRMPAASPAA